MSNLLNFKDFNELLLVINNENFNIGSKFQALKELSIAANTGEGSEFNIKTLGMWGCNISNQKFAEVLTHLRSKITSLEISDCPKEIKKQAVKSIAEIFLYQNY